MRAVPGLVLFAGLCFQARDFLSVGRNKFYVSLVSLALIGAAVCLPSTLLVPAMPGPYLALAMMAPASIAPAAATPAGSTMTVSPA